MFMAENVVGLWAVAVNRLGVLWTANHGESANHWTADDYRWRMFIDGQCPWMENILKKSFFTSYSFARYERMVYSYT